MSDNALPPSAQRVQEALTARGFGHLQVIEMPATTRTAAEAAAAIDTTVVQIAKSLVFRGAESSRPVLVIASGTNRVNTDRLAAHIGEALAKPDADYVREHTGFVIGGVPPLGHTSAIATYIDQDLQQYATIWAAAGTPRAVFQLTPDDLIALTGGTVLSVT